MQVVTLDGQVASGSMFNTVLFLLIHSIQGMPALRENVNKNLMNNYQQSAVVPKRRMIIKRLCQQINNLSTQEAVIELNCIYELQ